ncbi:MAG: hypothetical protein JWN91_1983 [Nocardioides sp.]|jgi:hypothetical protein|nr:hypothetical protein [Nocardioides sp.]
MLAEVLRAHDVGPPVAPSISSSLRNHWYSYSSGFGRTVPWPAVRVSPTAATPLIVATGGVVKPPTATL